MMDIRVNETAQILYRELNGSGYARQFDTASPTERLRYRDAAEKILQAIQGGES